MKVTFKKLGKIDNAALELNDLTIIAGANNTGKTYITYTLYGLLKNWREHIGLQFSDEILDKIMKEGVGIIPKERILDSFDKAVQEISKNYSKKIPDIFNDKEGNLNNASIEISLEKPDSLEGMQFIPLKSGDTYIMGKIENEFIYVSIIKTGDIPSVSFGNPLCSLIGEIAVSSYFPKPFISTAERLGISLFYKELDLAKNVLVEELQKLSKGKTGSSRINPYELVEKMSSRYAIPIRDNIHFTRDVDTIQKNSGDDRFKPIADKVRQMMEGYFKQVDKEIRFISRARKEGRFDIPLYLASTSARALTDLYFFLRHMAGEGMIIMIDEPESHLSPANQIEMARLFALCVNAGLKVFITTHSDYLIKEFNNLIMLSQEFEGKEDFLKANSTIYSKDDFLKPESVNAYICKDGTLHKCTVDKKGMDITSFDETIDDINRISDELDFLTGD